MLDINTILDKVKSHAQSLGVFGSVNTYEPTTPAGNDVDCSIWLDEIIPVSTSGLASTSVCITFTVAIYANMLAEPYEETDGKLIRALDALMTAYNGDFTLDGTIRNVDVFGRDTQGLRVQAEYFKPDDILFRVLTISLPLVVNDVWEQDE